MKHHEAFYSFETTTGSGHDFMKNCSMRIENAGATAWLDEQIFFLVQTLGEREFNAKTKHMQHAQHIEENQLSHEKIPPTFHYTGWLIGILITVYYNP